MSGIGVCGPKDCGGWMCEFHGLRPASQALINDLIDAIEHSGYDPDNCIDCGGPPHNEYCRFWRLREHLSFMEGDEMGRDEMSTLMPDVSGHQSPSVVMRIDIDDQATPKLERMVALIEKVTSAQGAVQSCAEWLIYFALACAMGFGIGYGMGVWVTG